MTSNLLGPISATESKAIMANILEQACKRASGDNDIMKKKRKETGGSVSDIAIQVLGEEAVEILGKTWVEYSLAFNMQFLAPQAGTTLKHRYGHRLRILELCSTCWRHGHVIRIK